MRRDEKEITGLEEIEAVIRSCQVCRLALIDGEYPYIVPLNFGYRDRTLYFHGALRGKKLSLLETNNKAAFEMDRKLEIVTSEDPCEWGMKFQSVIGSGRVSMIESPEEKTEALQLIMSQYTNDAFDMPEKRVKGTAVYKLEIKQMTGKQGGW